MKKQLFLYLILLIGSQITGQTNKKYALVQHFTNTRCGVCAGNNPIYYNNIQPLQADVHHISIHPIIPYSSCVLYQANTVEQDVLKNYYNVSGTPTFIVNGTQSSLSNINNAVTTTIATNSPIAVKATQTISGGNINATVIVKTSQLPPTANYVLYVAAVEKTLNYNAPNGETVHRDVFRKMFTNVSGQTIALTTTGFQTFTFTTPIPANWTSSEMYVLAWVQNVATKEVLNSANIFTPGQVATVSITTSSTTVCAGSSTTFTANPSNSGSSPTYQWKKNGANVGFNSSTFSTSSIANGDVITCQMTSNDPFVSISTVNSNSLTMNVTNSVVPNISISTPFTTICSGVNTTFAATSTNGGSNPTFQWKLNGNNIGTNNNTFSSSILQNTDIISCILTSNATCATVPIVSSNSVTMNVNNSVTPSLSINTPNTNICAGTNVTLTASATAGGTAPNYQWKKNGVNTGSNSNTYSSNTFSNGDIITCVLTSNANCTTSNTANSNNINLTVNNTQTPIISVNTNNTTICAGTNVSFIATPTFGGSQPIYIWKKNGISVGINSPNYSDNSISDGDVIICNLTSNANCVTNPNVSSNSVVMNVSPSLTPSISIVTPITTICQGTGITFTSNITNGGTNPNYQWKKNNINIGINSPSFSDNNWVNNDLIQCVLTSNANCLTTPNTTSNNIQVIVNPSVTPSLTISTSTLFICSGTNVTFSATTYNGGNSPIYQWKKNGNNVGSNSDTYNDNTLINDDAVTCVVTSNALCRTKDTFTTTPLIMNVSTNVIPTINIFTNTTNVCLGNSVEFTSSQTFGGASPSYQWKNNGLNVGNNSPSYTASDLKNGDKISCNLLSNATCVSNQNANSNILTLSVNPSESPTVRISTPDTNFCYRTNAIFTASTTFGGTNPMYQWKLNGNNVGNNSPTYSNDSLQNNDIVNCNIISNQLCVSNSLASSNLIKVNVKTPVNPGIIISTPNQNVCEDSMITFKTNTTFGGSNPTYQWQLNYSNIGTNLPTYTSTTLKNNDIVRCILTSSEACIINSPSYSNIITVFVNPIVTPTITIRSSALSIKKGEPVVFFGTVTDGGSNPSFQWKLNGVPVGTNKNNYTDSTLNNGDIISCDLISNAICTSNPKNKSNDIKITVNPPNAVNDIEFMDLKIYPNPTNNIVTIQLNEPAKEDLNILIIDLLGKTVSNSNIAQGAETLYLDTKVMNPGQYLMKLSNGDKSIIRKLVVLR